MCDVEDGVESHCMHTVKEHFSIFSRSKLLTDYRHRFIGIKHVAQPQFTKRASTPPSQPRLTRATRITRFGPSHPTHIRHHGLHTRHVFLPSLSLRSALLANTATDYASFLPRLLPSSLASPLLTLVTTGLGLTRTLQTHLTPLLTRVVTQPDIATILALLAIFFISLKILDMAYRAVMFWVNMVIRLVFWGGIVVLGMWIWNRGPDGFVEDIGGLFDFWSGEYEKYSGEVKSYREHEQGQIKMKAEQKKRGWY
ncbi:nuclear pore assembly and biogenesis-domain-containing protein [Phaeosphaeria sp. MPI-PUGE-AT-0046c]|nr:nuclear pore assembly and biogenesis-domain-containing protein [Phaeosphaeria sp. MPI-PUGE-AT-0046c]